MMRNSANPRLWPSYSALSLRSCRAALNTSVSLIGKFVNTVITVQMEKALEKIWELYPSAVSTVGNH